MKQVLSMDQVNERLSGNTNLHCYKVDYSHFNNEPYYHFILGKSKALIVAFGKKVYYHELHGENERVFKDMAITIDNKEYVPLIDKVEHEKLLIICGLKEAKKVKEQSPYERLKEIAGKDYATIYKMMDGLDIFSADLVIKYRQDYWGNDKGESYTALVVTHSRGSFSIPIENVAEIPDNNNEIQNIFFNALNLPTTSKLKTA